MVPQDSGTGQLCPIPKPSFENVDLFALCEVHFVLPAENAGCMLHAVASCYMHAAAAHRKHAIPSDPNKLSTLAWVVSTSWMT